MASKKIVFGGAGTALAAAVAMILTGIYQDEGGHVKHPSDPGGETNLGVTVGVARDAGYKGPMRLFPKQCEGPEDVCGDRIYFERYMQEPGYLPIILANPAVGEEIVNSAVNFGPPRPSRWVQQSLNEMCPSSKLADDGRVGPATQAAFARCQATYFCVSMLDKLDGKQRDEYDRLVQANPKLKVFHKGWISHRIGNVDRAKCGQAVA
jgi:lysozyme family protein